MEDKPRTIYGVEVNNKYIDYKYTIRKWWFSKEEAKKYISGVNYNDPDLSFKLIKNILIGGGK